MFGNESEGPANNKAKAGPSPIPEASRPWTMGTSVSVAKYMKAPRKLAQKLDNKELPPTHASIHSGGTTPATFAPSCVEPNKKPAERTPTASNGNICFAKPHEANNHSLFSPFPLSRSNRTNKTDTPTSMGTSGINLASRTNIFEANTDTATSAPPHNTSSALIFKYLTNTHPNKHPIPPVTYHLEANTQPHIPDSACDGAPQLANTRRKATLSA